MKLLSSEYLENFDSLGWAERSISQLHNQLSIVVKRRCGKKVADMFAMPEQSGEDKIDYFTEPYETATRYVDLLPADRLIIDTEIEERVARIEALRRDLLASDTDNDRNIATVIDLVMKIPDTEHIWRVDGKPVVTMWGHAGNAEAFDLRSIKTPAPPPVAPSEPAPPPVTPSEPAPRARWPFAVAVLALLLLGGYLAWPAVACMMGWRACHAPIAVADSGILRIGTQEVDIDIVGNDVEPDGDPITLVSCDAPGQVQDGRRVRYVRDPAFTGDTAKFTCTVSDPDGNTDSAMVSVEVLTARNRPPRAQPDTFELPLGVAFAEHDILNNDQDESPFSLSVKSCDAPPIGRVTIKGRTVRFEHVRDNLDEARSTTFFCTVVDNQGLTDRSAVIVNIPAVANTAPTGQTIYETLEVGTSFTDIDILDAMTDAEGDAMRVDACSAPGVLYGKGARYERKDGATGVAKFSCRVKDARGATGTVSVHVTIAEEITTCTPISKELPVRIIIGLDVSTSMDSPASTSPFSNSLKAIKTIIDDAPASVSVTLIGMQGDASYRKANTKTGTADIRRYLRDIVSQSNGAVRARPSFELYSNWLTDALKETEGRYALTIVVTITDAEDEYPNQATKLIPVFKGYNEPLEHIVILLNDSVEPAKQRSFKAVTWPPDESNYHQIGNSQLSGLTSSILQAARIEERSGC